MLFIEQHPHVQTWEAGVAFGAHEEHVCCVLVNVLMHPYPDPLAHTELVLAGENLGQQTCLLACAWGKCLQHPLGH